MGNKMRMIKILWLEQEEKKSAKKVNKKITNHTRIKLINYQIMLITRQQKDIQLVSFFKKVVMQKHIIKVINNYGKTTEK